MNVQIEVKKCMHRNGQQTTKQSGRIFDGYRFIPGCTMT